MADGITRIAVEGFKSIAKRQEIEIAPLTILAGANSSGKSSIMQPLLMLKQTLEATYDPGPLKIDGPNVTFTRNEEFLSKIGGESNLHFRVEVATESLGFKITFLKKQELGLEVREATYRLLGSSVTLRPEMSPKELKEVLSAFEPFKEIAHLQFSIIPRRFFLNLKRDDLSRPVSLEYGSDYIEDVIHVPGLRGNQLRAYRQTGTGPLFPGTFDNYIASVILRWQRENVEGPEQLVDDLRHTGLARMVLAQRISDVAIELHIALDDFPRRLDNIADVGFGVSQVLPVLVALRAAEPGRLVYLEEPEIHLHPRAQTKLADILAGAAKRGVRVVAETHSTLLLTAIQTLVAKGELSPDLVKLHWFQRDPKTGITQVTSADLDENGAFGDWPEDFDEVALDMEGAYLDAVEGRKVP
jgi:predicted ATPase